MMYYLDIAESSAEQNTCLSYRSIPVTSLPRETTHMFPAKNVEGLLKQYGQIQVTMGIALEAGTEVEIHPQVLGI